MSQSDVPPLPAEVSPEQIDFATATEAIQAVPVSRAGLVRFGIGFAFLGFMWIGGLAVVLWVVLPQRLTDAGIENPAALLGAVNAFGTVFALISNILWGVMSDRTRSRFGRRTPWIITGTVLAGFFLWASGVVEQPAMIIAVFCAFQVCLNMLLAPATTVLSDRVPQSARGVVSACYGTGLAVGTQVGVLIGASLLTNTSAGFLIGASIVAAAGIFAVLVWPKEPSTKHLPAATRGLKDVIASLRPPRNAPDFWWAFTSRFFMLIAYQMIFTYQVYIVQNYIGQTVKESAATLSTMAIIALVCSLAGSITGGPLSDLFKRRRMPVLLTALLFAVGMAMPWIWPSPMGMFLYAGIAGLGFGAYGSVDQALLVDVLPDKETAGKDLAILNMSTTAGATLGPIITSTVVTITGSYALAFPVAIGFAVVGAFCVLRIRNVR